MPGHLESRLAKHLELESIEACGLPLALEIVGERWSFMILRAAFNGVRNFDDFQSVLGIARNILSVRLVKLVENGIMVREPSAIDRRKVEYHLTRKGEDLLPALLALRQWGEKYELGVPENPVLVDARDRKPIGPFEIRASDGRVLRLPDLMWVDRSELGDAEVDCCGPGELPGLRRRGTVPAK
jgi:DNA-binding HxlR family transcriptional regulator